MYEEALQLGAPTSALFAKLARTYAGMHHYKRALAEYAKAARLQPGDPALLLEKVAMLLRMRDTDRAAAELDACAALLTVPRPLPLSPPVHTYMRALPYRALTQTENCCVDEELQHQGKREALPRPLRLAQGCFSGSSGCEQAHSRM